MQRAVGKKAHGAPEGLQAVLYVGSREYMRACLSVRVTITARPEVDKMERL